MWLVLTPHVSSAPEQAEGGNKGSVKEVGNDLRACTMSAEIPLDADGSHPEQASESRVTASNMSHVSQRDEQAEKARDRRQGRKSLFQTDPIASVTIRRVLTYVEQMT